MSVIGHAYDAGHLSFLQLVQVITATAGANFAKGTLIKTGTSSASHFEDESYESWEAFVRALEVLECSIARFEGRATHFGDGVFGLPACPFASSIKTYNAVIGSPPRDYASVTEELNRDSPITSELRIGDGAAVSPFCAVHQSIRRTLGRKITIAAKRAAVYQLGCKSRSGVKGISKKQCEAASVPISLVERVLDSNMCCYRVLLER
jgi:hypothetical protein